MLASSSKEHAAQLINQKAFSTTSVSIHVFLQIHRSNYYIPSLLLIISNKIVLSFLAFMIISNFALLLNQTLLVLLSNQSN